MSVTSKLLDPKNDIAFKRIFGTERNKEILLHFLNDMLTIQQGIPPIKSLSFLPTIQDPEIASQKTSIVDVLCTDEHENRYIVEMQFARSKGFEKRAQYYASQVKKKGHYEDLKEVIFLAIADYIMFTNKKTIKSNHVILDTEPHEYNLKGFSFTFLELPKFQKGEDDLHHLENPIEKWCYFFKYAEDIDPLVLRQILEKNTIMEQAVQELIRYNWTEEELNLYEEADKSRSDYESSLLQKFDEGIAKGKEEANREIALKLKKEGMSNEKIFALLRVSLE